MAHGASAEAAFKLRKETRRERIKKKKHFYQPIP